MAIVVLWGLGVVVALVLGHVYSEAAVVCNLRRLTGVPCPGCGSTRAVVALARGDVIAGLVLNPLAVLVLVVATGLLAHRLATGRRLVVEAGSRPKAIAAALGAAAVIANWIWVIGHA